MSPCARLHARVIFHPIHTVALQICRYFTGEEIEVSWAVSGHVGTQTPSCLTLYSTLSCPVTEFLNSAPSIHAIKKISGGSAVTQSPSDLLFILLSSLDTASRPGSTRAWVSGQSSHTLALLPVIKVHQ